MDTASHAPPLYVRRPPRPGYVRRGESHLVPEAQDSTRNRARLPKMCRMTDVVTEQRLVICEPQVSMEHLAPCECELTVIRA